jgi:putative FmdB family regulatory protein
MPTYEYKCLDCGHKFDRFQSIKDEPVKDCEKCGKTVKRLIGSGGGIIFKGNGFYVNDYRKAASKNSACSSCPASAGGEPCSSSGSSE